MEDIIQRIEQYSIQEYNYQNSDSMSQASTDECYDDNYYPDLGKLTIDDILAQDDPPKELYLGYEFLDFTEEEYVLAILFKEEYYSNLQYECSSFDIYEHFGIPSDISDGEAEGWLEAARGSS